MAAADASSQKKSDQKSSVLQNGNFRWLWFSYTITTIGEQFTIIALPWLAVQMSGDAMDLGSVLALAVLPRVMLILFGGALVDKYSPKRILLYSKVLSSCTLMALIASVWYGWLTIDILYLATFMYGLASALDLPASQSYPPLVVDQEHIPAANSLQMATRQIGIILIPMIGGLIIAALSINTDASFVLTQDYTLLHGIAAVLAIDVVCYLLSSLVIAFNIKLKPVIKNQTDTDESLLNKISDGFRYIFRDKPLRALIFYMLLTSVFANGIMRVCIPYIADKNDTYGADLMGWLLGAQAIGAMIGMAISGLRPQMKLISLGLTVVALDLIVSAVLIGMAYTHATLIAMFALLPVFGMANGISQVKVFSWVQTRVERQYLGRAMAVVMFINIAIAAASPLLAGYVLSVADLYTLFVFVGGGLAGTALLGALLFNMLNVGRHDDSRQPGDPEAANNEPAADSVAEAVAESGDEQAANTKNTAQEENTNQEENASQEESPDIAAHIATETTKSTVQQP